MGVPAEDSATEDDESPRKWADEGLYDLAHFQVLKRQKYLETLVKMDQDRLLVQQVHFFSCLFVFMFVCMEPDEFMHREHMRGI